MQPHNRKLVLVMLFGALASITMTGLATASLSGSDHIISQKGKRFGPGDVALHVGEHITVVNDDNNFVHQAYVDHEAFAFDSGDIEPGDKVVITFPTEGDFTVLCGVHPKMKLAVHVR
ncbi:methylamine utilization protein [Methylobacterium sp. E-005]|uniref:methylamine utilization protein n=1 Tax=Methylobacterium sp. E-005 TaxID=2836549 RepID=UPI001FBB0CAE|nr:methylamine utilization protein [Methylobacterium sp. E-005]MCJ2085839.1 methylamine utilization protein [Methylobacterium sp. E-005]